MADIALIEPGPLAQIALAIRARLEVVFPPKQFTHRWMPARIDRDVWQKLTTRMPMVGIGFNSLHNSQTTSTFSAMSRWTVYVATVNEASAEAVLFGDKIAPGQFAVAGIAAAMLHGFTIKGIGTIQIGEAANSFVEDFKADGLAVTAIELTVPVQLAPGDVLAGNALIGVTLAGETITWAFGGDTVVDQITNTGDIMKRPTPEQAPRILVMPGGDDRRVPVENLRRTYFEAGVPREVYDTVYIRRRLLDGDLIEVTAEGTPVVKAGATAAASPTAAAPAKAQAQADLEAASARTANRAPIDPQPAPAAADTKTGGTA